MNKKIIAVTMLVFIFSTTYAYANTHAYHPASTIKLGFGFDPNNPFDDKSKSGCFKWESDGKEISNENILSVTDKNGMQLLTEDNLVKFNESGNIKFEISEISNRKDLYERLGISASVASKYAFVKGRATFEQEKSITFSKKSLVYIITASRYFVKEYMSGIPKLTKTGQELLTKAKNAKPRSGDVFYNSCGEELVTSQIRGASISVVYSFKTSSLNKRNKLRAKLDVRFTSGSVSTTLSQDVSSVDESAKVSVWAYQTGAGNDIPSIIPIINTRPGDISTIKNVVKDAISAIKRADSPVVSATTVAIDNLPEIAGAFPDIEYSEEARINKELLRLQNLLYTNEERVSLLNNLLENYNSNDYVVEADIQIASGIEILDGIANSIWEAGLKCSKATKYENCKNKVRTLPRWNPSQYLNGYVNYIGWGVSSSSSWNRHERFNGYASFWPIVNFKNVAYIEFVTLLRNGIVVAVMQKKDINVVNQNNNSLGNYYTASHSVIDQYCWGGTAEAQCKKGIEVSAISAGKGAENQRKYTLEVNSIDGSKQRVEIPSI